MADELKPDEPFVTETPKPNDPLPSELNRQGDYISGDVGADGKSVVVGKNIDVDSSQRNQQQSVYFHNTDNAIIWQQLLRMDDESAKGREKLNETIHTLDMRLDGLPDRVGKLEVVVKPATELEKLIYLLLRSTIFLVVVVVLGVAGVFIYLWLR